MTDLGLAVFLLLLGVGVPLCSAVLTNERRLLAARRREAVDKERRQAELVALFETEKAPQ